MLYIVKLFEKVWTILSVTNTYRPGESDVVGISAAITCPPLAQSRTNGDAGTGKHTAAD